MGTDKITNKSLCYSSKSSFFFVATPRSLQDPSSPTRDQTQTPAVQAPSPNRWTARGFLQ